MKGSARNFGAREGKEGRKGKRRERSKKGRNEGKNKRIRERERKERESEKSKGKDSDEKEGKCPGKWGKLLPLPPWQPAPVMPLAPLLFCIHRPM